MTEGEEATAAVVEKFKNLISENGTIEKFEEWGGRRLAYLIEDLAEGFYVYAEYKAPQAFPAELDRLFNINDMILRSITIAK